LLLVFNCGCVVLCFAVLPTPLTPSRERAGEQVVGGV
jgi:hypothetical protein